MENTKTLITNTLQTTQRTVALEKDVERLEETLDLIHADLEISKRINNQLHDLDSAITTTIDLLDVVRIIPAISSSADRLKTALNTFHTPIKTARKSSDGLEVVVAPARGAVGAGRNSVNRFDVAVLRIIGLENRFIETLCSATRCINSHSDTVIRSSLEESIETASAVLNPVVTTFDEQQSTAITIVGDANTQAQDIRNITQNLSEVSQALSEVTNRLDPLIASLRELASALNKTITVGWTIDLFIGEINLSESFSIRQIINGISGVAGWIIDRFNSLMANILNPILDALDLDFELPTIPGLEVLEELLTSLEVSLPSLNGLADTILSPLAHFSEFIQELERYKEQLCQLDWWCNTSGSKRRMSAEEMLQQRHTPSIAEIAVVIS